jgi:hypothetical protein
MTEGTGFNGELTDLVTVISYEDEVVPDKSTVAGLATVLEHRAHQDISVEIQQIMAVGPDGKLATCSFRVEGGDKFDDQDWAHPKVTVTFPDGHEESAYYRIDGRA